MRMRSVLTISLFLTTTGFAVIYYLSYDSCTVGFSVLLFILSVVLCVAVTVFKASNLSLEVSAVGIVCFFGTTMVGATSSEG